MYIYILYYISIHISRNVSKEFKRWNNWPIPFGSTWEPGEWQSLTASANLDAACWSLEGIPHCDHHVRWVVECCGDSKAQGNSVESKWSIKGNILVLNILADLSSSDFGMMDYFVCRPFGERSWSRVQYLVVSVGKWLITPVYSSYQYHEYGIVPWAQWQLGNRVPTGVIHSPLHLPHATCALCQVSQDLVAPKVAFMGKHVDCFPCWCLVGNEGMIQNSLVIIIPFPHSHQFPTKHQ